MTYGIDLTGVGSSPLTRGKPRRLPTSPQVPRLIPAHAGKTPRERCRRRPSPAHPRSRGENSTAAQSCAPRQGSSPLTRGKPGGEHPATGVHRLIPAHAGKTRCRSCGRITRAAHPRSRGENPRPTPIGRGAFGSSPLTRGKPPRSHEEKPMPRLIPAHAGKTASCAAYPACSTAHPRSRGENRRERMENCHRPGSSPLTRGKRNDPMDAPVRSRLIPAHAGKTPRPQAK